MRNYVSIAKTIDESTLSEKDAKELEEAIADAQAILDSTTGVVGEAEECEARLINCLAKVGKTEAPAKEQDPTLLRKISLWLYDNYGTNGFSEIPKIAIENMFK